VASIGTATSTVTTIGGVSSSGTGCFGDHFEDALDRSEEALVGFLHRFDCPIGVSEQALAEQ
jgi:hypothetical protein